MNVFVIFFAVIGYVTTIWVVGYRLLGPLSCGRPPFSPPDGTPAEFEPWKPWKHIR